MTDTFLRYFEAETGLCLPDDLLAIIATYYADHRREYGGYRGFCRDYTRNKGGVADHIRMLANIRRDVERTRAADTIAELQRQLAQARAAAGGMT